MSLLVASRFSQIVQHNLLKTHTLQGRSPWLGNPDAGPTPAWPPITVCVKADAFPPTPAPRTCRAGRA